MEVRSLFQYFTTIIKKASPPAMVLTLQGDAQHQYMVFGVSFLSNCSISFLKDRVSKVRREPKYIFIVFVEAVEPRPRLLR